MIFLGALIVVLIAAYLVLHNDDWLLFVALGCASILTVMLLLQQRSQTLDNKLSNGTKQTVIHNNKADYAAVVTDIVTKYTTSGKSTGEETVEQELLSLVVDAQGLDLDDALKLEKHLAHDNAEPTLESIQSFMANDLTERDLLCMGGIALWGNSVEFRNRDA